METLRTITLSDALTLSDFSGPLGRYFAGLADYFIKEPAAISVEVELSRVPGYHKTWDAAITNKLLLRDLEAADARREQEAERRAEAGYEVELDRWASDQAYREEYASFGSI